MPRFPELAAQWEAQPGHSEDSLLGKMTFGYRVKSYCKAGQLERARRLLLSKAGPGRNYRDFQLSDLLGKLGEYVWAQFLGLRGHDLLEGPREEYFPDYDLKACWRGLPYTYEVKTDWYPQETGNIPIELGETPNGQQRPSGARSTKADWYAVYFPRWGWAAAVKTAELLKFIENHKLQPFNNSKSGRGTWGVHITKDAWTTIPTGRIVDVSPVDEMN